MSTPSMIEEIITKAGHEADIRIEPGPPKRRYAIKRRPHLEAIAAGDGDAAIIARYLLRREISRTELAQRLFTSSGQISSILSGRIGVSKKMRLRMAEIGVLSPQNTTEEPPLTASVDRPKNSKTALQERTRTRLMMLAAGSGDLAAIARYMLQHNLTMRQVSERLKISQPYVAGVVTGRYSISQPVRSRLVNLGVLQPVHIEPSPVIEPETTISIRVMISNSELRRLIQLIRDARP